MSTLSTKDNIMNEYTQKRGLYERKYISITE